MKVRTGGVTLHDRVGGVKKYSRLGTILRVDRDRDRDYDRGQRGPR
jgi:hypothetical protein